MRRMRATVLVGLALTISVAACSRDKQPELMNIRSTSKTPDEFAILPNKPLQMPQDLAALPEPTPGAANLVDPTPEADAVAALGGNPERLAQSGLPAADGALLAQTGRYGIAGDIRAALAAEDLEYRRRNDGRVLERLFNVTVYYRAYRPMSLDQHAELERWRRAGAQNVGAPPEQ